MDMYSALFAKATSKGGEGGGVLKIYKINPNQWRLEDNKNAKNIYDDLIAGEIVCIDEDGGLKRRFLCFSIWENGFQFGSVSNSNSSVRVSTLTADNLTEETISLAYINKDAS